MIHLNGPENHEKLKERSEQFARMSTDSTAGCMYTIIVDKGSVSVGKVTVSINHVNFDFWKLSSFPCLNFVDITLYPLSRSLSVQGLRF